MAMAKKSVKRVIALLGIVLLTGAATSLLEAQTPARDADAKKVAPAIAAPDDPATIASLAEVKKRAATEDYERARWDPIHFKPAIDFAKDEACLTCHSEIMSDKPRATSPAGVKASDTEAWYQTLSTYAGSQEVFHWRHIQSPYAKQVMNLQCNFCHQGNDPRERSPSVTAVKADGSNITSWRDNRPAFNLRNVVNPSETCLRCHGTHPYQLMALPEPWPKMRADLENEDMPNGCLSCHGELMRTVRHQVTYLKADNIEKLAKDNSDVCYGCHGGRAWYRISYPYPRHPWPNMPEETPDWAKNRPTQSDARFRLPEPSTDKK